MVGDLNQFSQRMFGLANKVEPNANLMVQDAAAAFLEEVVSRTPVDSGQAVSSWKVGLNYIPRGVRTFSPGAFGSTASANRSAVLSSELPKVRRRRTGQTISVVNTAPYISRLNDGTSAQAPAGFIETAYIQSTRAIRRRKVLE